MIITTKTGIHSYADLLLYIAQLPYATFVTEIPKNWHWGQSLKIVATSAQVTAFSGYKAPKWNGEDLSKLYHREVLEPQIEMLLRELERSPNKHLYIPNVEYRSFVPDSDREYLHPHTENEYNSDIEMIYLPDLDAIYRICQCKERRALSR